ncbi:MAG: nuclear transport factor 2 family protein [Ignavibacteriae bacterium]|nr:nuclear transport factor 2 family protein [Ignavibacteriota bacterium]
MRYLILVVITFILLSCERTSENSIKEYNFAVSDSLKNIAINYLKSWEPPFDPKGSLKLFSKTNDFTLISDGFYVPSFNKWEEVTFGSMQHEAEEHLNYKHEIEEIRCTILSENSGVVSVLYKWYGTKKDKNKSQYFNKGAITIVCRREGKNWKIVHYHGSHQDDQLVEQ